MVRDIDGPVERAVVFSRPERGFDTRGMPLLPLHVELSSGHRWNHTAIHQHAPLPVEADRVEVSSIFIQVPPPPPKENESWHHTPVAVRAATGPRMDPWEVSPVDRWQWGSNRHQHGWRWVRYC